MTNDHVLRLVPDDVVDDELDLDGLGSRIVGMAGRLAAATCRWLLLVAAFDARDGARSFGLPSTARWLSHYCGLSGRTARAHVAVAGTLVAHPALADAMGSGRLSYSHVRAIGRVAEFGGARLVAELIEIAEHGTVGQLEDVVRGLRTVEDSESPGPKLEREAVSHRWRPDSLWALSARLDPEGGVLVQAAIEQVARREGITHAAALTRIAEIALAAAANGEQPAPSLRGDEYAAVVVHVDADRIPPESGPAGPPRGLPAGRIARGPGLSDAVVRRLACTGRIRTAVFRHGERPGDPVQPLDVGASRRLVSDRQYRALLIRDGGCTHPGCAARVGLEAHHVRHWLYGGRTAMANLVLLCRRHHHALHDGAFTIRPRGRGRFRFLRSDGKELPRHVDPGPLIGTRSIENDHRDVRFDAATTRWDGTRLNHAYAVDTLAQVLTR